MEELLKRLQEVYRRYFGVKNIDRKIDSYSTQIVSLVEQRQELLKGIDDDVDNVADMVEDAIKEHPEDRSMREVKKLLDRILDEQERLKMRQDD